MFKSHFLIVYSGASQGVEGWYQYVTVLLAQVYFFTEQEVFLRTRQLAESCDEVSVTGLHAALRHDNNLWTVGLEYRDVG